MESPLFILYSSLLRVEVVNCSTTLLNHSIHRGWSREWYPDDARSSYALGRIKSGEPSCVGVSALRKYHSRAGLFWSAAMESPLFILHSSLLPAEVVNCSTTLLNHSIHWEWNSEWYPDDAWNSDALGRIKSGEPSCVGVSALRNFPTCDGVASFWGALSRYRYRVLP